VTTSTRYNRMIDCYFCSHCALCVARDNQLLLLYTPCCSHAVVPKIDRFYPITLFLKCCFFRPFRFYSSVRLTSITKLIEQAEYGSARLTCVTCAFAHMLNGFLFCFLSSPLRLFFS